MSSPPPENCSDWVEILHLCTWSADVSHTHKHTCSEQSLRILMWNASCVPKTSPITPHIPCPKMKQVRDKGVPSSYHHGKAVSSLVDDCQTMRPPPAAWLEVLHLFRCFTHTPSRGGKIKVRKMRWYWTWKEMKMRWKWNWDEGYLTRTRRGERKRRRSKHQHKWTWPKAGKPWKGKGKEKRRPTDTEQDQRRGGRTEAPKPTYRRETYAHLSTRRTQPTCREGKHMK